MMESSAPVDDRKDTEISYAAMNLVIPGKTSKRTDSNPPAGKVDGFPPTPPPERDAIQSRARESPALGRQPSRGAAGPAAGVTRSGSNARPGTAPRGTERRDRRRDDIAEEEEEEDSRYGAALPLRRANTAKSETSSSRPGYGRQASVRRAPTNASSNRRRDYEDGQDGDDIDDFYDYYGTESRSGGTSRRNSGGRRQPSRRQPSYDDDYQSEGDNPSEDEEEFEMMGSRRGGNKRVPDIKNVCVHNPNGTLCSHANNCDK